MKTITTLLSLILAISCFGQKDIDNAWIVGEWKGDGVQIDNVKWGIIMTAKSEYSITVSYPDLSCGGIWNKIEDEPDNTQYIESITLGSQNCDQGAEIHLSKIDDNTLELIYYLRAYDPVNPIAKAVMKRQ